jgi:hypothetical protein
MKHAIILFLSLWTISAYGQDKTNYVHFNRLKELTGTDYTIATIEHLGKMAAVNSTQLLFINTRTGQSKQVDFPKDGKVSELEQIRIDSLQINRVIVEARTVNLDNSKRIDWSDPYQVFGLSTDGEEKVQLTPDNFYTRTWAVNHRTGGLVITGHYDSNNNGKYDKTDKSEILLFDLKTLKLITKI